MTTRKLIIVIGTVLVSVALIIAIFVGGIVGLVFYSIGKSEATETAKTFLKNNEKLKQNIGNVTDFGTFVTGSINKNNADGEAALSLKVIGEKRVVNAKVYLMYKSNRAWRVTNASYEDENGKSINLLDPYEPVTPEP